MITYKKWRTLNESFGGAIPIGLGQHSVVGGVVGAHELDEAAKKAKKKMFGDDEDAPPPEDDEKEPEDKGEDMDKPEKEDKPEPKDDGGDGEPEPKEDEGGDEKPAFFSKKKACKSCKKSKKKMTKEESEWYNSVMGQINSDPNKRFWDGFTKLEEDALIAPTDPNAEVTEPGPGEPGFAPQQRVGGWFSN